MANSEILDLVMTTVSTTVLYMLPVVGFLAGVNWVIGWLMWILFSRKAGMRD